jgi:hypothetical protein
MPGTVLPPELAADRRHRVTASPLSLPESPHINSPFRVVSSPHVSFLLIALVSHAKFGITQLSQLVNATSSISRVILKTRSFIPLLSNNPPFLSICAPTTSLVSPIMADQHRASSFGSRLIVSCRVLCLGPSPPPPRFLFHFLYCF